ncbi:hypothetical protein [Vibrio neptunius]|uniref:hypothetical protein n=1 Tax=Vibrio neptunius TaxID=170651 RepID=UPI001F09E7DD|nr:hypothetical protein [Vibrio neptunius]
MSRPLRIEYAGALYHVTSRGNARQPIYLDEQCVWGQSNDAVTSFDGQIKAIAGKSLS